MYFTYPTDVFLLACDTFLTNFENNKPSQEEVPDMLDYEHVLRSYQTTLKAKSKPSSVMLCEYELELLGEYL
jgi:hypothetical protein